VDISRRRRNDWERGNLQEVDGMKKKIPAELDKMNLNDIAAIQKWTGLTPSTVLTYPLIRPPKIA